MIQKEVQTIYLTSKDKEENNKQNFAKSVNKHKKEQFYPQHYEPYPPQTYKLIHHGCLIVFELTSHVLSVIVFHTGEQDVLYKGNVKKNDLTEIDKIYEDGYSLNTLYDDIVAHSDKSVYSISANRISIRIGSQSTSQSYNCNKERETPTVSVDLIPIKISQKQAISHIKDYHTTKEESFKQEILRLKSQIYSLMTELQHVTGLIKSQSVQAKNARIQIKELKKELDVFRNKEKERKSSMDFGVQCKLSDSGEEQDPIMNELNTKVKNLIQNIKNDNPITALPTNTSELKTIQIFLQQELMKENSQPSKTPIQSNQLLKKKTKLPRTSSESYIHSGRLSGMMEKTDKLYRIDSIWKSNVVQSA